MHDNVRRARALMERSRNERFAVGAFNVDNQETLVAIARAAQVKRSPVLVEVSHGEVAAIGLANMRDMVDNYRAELGIEMYINLDHSPSVEAARAGDRRGLRVHPHRPEPGEKGRDRPGDHRRDACRRRVRGIVDRCARRERAPLLRRELERP